MTDTAAPAPTAAPPGGVAGLFPGYFALVMATGIIAVGAELEDLPWLADVLFVVAAVGYVVLLLLTIARLVTHPRLLAADLTSHARGFSFLTVVAATNVLGSAAAVVHGWWDLAWVLWWVGVVVWPILLYAALIAVVLRSPKPGLGKGINGTWFLLTVSTQSVAVLGALLLPRHVSDGLAFACLGLFLLGIVLYLIVMTLVFQRWTLQDLDPTELDPPAWIAAGAVAITVLAGSNLLAATAVSPRLDRLAATIEVLVTLAWATATFWFPVMVAIGVWRHVVRRQPLRYHPSYWSLVFPLGMYAVATHRMLDAIRVGALESVPEVALAAAVAAWAATFLGLVTALGTAARREQPS